MKELWYTLVALLAVGQLGLGARILAFFPFPARSHHIAIQPVIKALAERGHEVDFYSALPMSNPPKTLKEFLIKDMPIQAAGANFSARDFGATPTPLFSYFLYHMLTETMSFTYQTKDIQKLIHSDQKYDLVIGEFFFMNEDGAALIHKFNAPGVAIHPLGDCAWVNEISGLPDNPSYMIDFKSLFTDKMDFFQRVYNFYTTAATNLVSYLFVTFPLQTHMDTYFNYTGWESRPRLPMLISDLALILTNSHHSIGYAYPKAPHVKEVAGLNLVEKNTPLPKEFQTFMDSAKDGVVYFSLGSVVDMREMMDNGVADAFMNVFKNLKQKVLWKWKSEIDIPKEAPANIKFSTWFPQQDILAHKNMKLFITHGGLMSTIEAVNYGVPMVGMAVFADQPKNIKRMVSAGYGVELNLNNLTEPAISWAVNEVLGNPSYKTEILKRQAIFKDRPMKPIEESIYWIEYVLKHGNVLQPASARMPFYQLYLIDVFAVITVVACLIMYIIKKVLCSLCSKLTGKKSQNKISKSKKRN